MESSNLYSKLLNAPKNAPVFLSQNLEADFIVKAYTFGLFPWTSKPVTWWCPDPRCILIPNQIHIQKNMKYASKRWKFTRILKNFSQVNKNTCILISFVLSSVCYRY